MRFNQKELGIIAVSAAVLAFSLILAKISVRNFLVYFAFIAVIILANVIVKKVVAYYYEADLDIKFLHWYQYGFRKHQHFSKPLPMFWFPLLVSLVTMTYFQWFGILESTLNPRIERVAKRHLTQKYTAMSEFQSAVILSSGILANLVLVIISFFLLAKFPGLSTFVNLNLYYAFWSLVPVFSLDGTKILFHDRIIWIGLVILTIIVSVIALAV